MVAVLAFGWYYPTPRATIGNMSAGPKENNPSSAMSGSLETQLSPSEYVGPSACAKCHAEIFSEFQATSHVRTCRVPRSNEMPIGFASGRGQFKSSYPGLRFEMSQVGHNFVQTTIRTTPAGEQRTSARIDLVYGAGGTADDVFLSWRDDDHLVELPMVWLYQLNKWGASHFDPNGSGDYSRALTLRCLECHNTWLEHVPGTTNQYRRDGAILGVTCESCHGPGHKHVEFHEANPEAEIGHAIVHPGHLTRDRQTDVCLQCHSNSITHRGPAFSYRPGESLEDHYRFLSTNHTEDDHVANQIKYLRESKCYQKSDNLTCSTCHNPHLAKAPDNAGSLSCQKCHQPVDCLDRDRLPAPVQNNCIDCHMRRYLKINVNFQTEDDNFVVPFQRYNHRISVDPVARKEVLLNWYRKQSDDDSREAAKRLTQALVDHWLAEAEQCRSDYRYVGAVAAIREALLIQTTPDMLGKLREAVALQASLDDDWAKALKHIAQDQSAEAIETFSKILSVKPDDAKAHGKLGTQYAKIGKKELAIGHLRAVRKYDPDDAYGEAMLGWLALLDSNLVESLEHYLRADEIEPYEAKINFHLGLALAGLNRLPEATERFRKAIAIEPNHLEACDCLILALRQQGKSQEAVTISRRAAQITNHRNLDVLMTLAETYADAGQFTEALDTATRALRLAESDNPSRVPQVRRTMESIRDRAKRELN